MTLRRARRTGSEASGTETRTRGPVSPSDTTRGFDFQLPRLQLPRLEIPGLQMPSLQSWPGSWNTALPGGEIARQFRRRISRSSRRVELDGYLHPDFFPVAETLRNVLRGRGGGAACVYHRGECVLDLWGGARDSAGNPWDRDTMAPSFSTTKGVASTLLHIMVDRGHLSYEDPVAAHWPGFESAGKHEITVRHVLTHQAGLYHIRQMIDDAARMLDWEHMATAIAGAAPAHAPGERTGYHGLTYGFIVGEILRQITGKSFSALVEEELATPLELDGLYCGLPEHELERAAQLIWPEGGPFASERIANRLGRDFGEKLLAGSVAVGKYLQVPGLDFESLVDALAPEGISDFDFGSHESLRQSIPSGNGVFTARSLAKLYSTLANGGAHGDTRLLSEETLARAIQRQGATGRRAVIPFDMRWRLGYHGVFTTRGVPARGFGHFGFGGSGAWADPDSELSVAFVVNSGMGTPFGDLRLARLGGAALDCARKH